MGLAILTGVTIHICILSKRLLEPIDQRRKDSQIYIIYMSKYNKPCSGRKEISGPRAIRVRTHSFGLWNQKRFSSVILFGLRSNLWLSSALLCTARSWLLQTPFPWLSCQPLPARFHHLEATEKDWRTGGREEPGISPCIWASVFSPVQWKNKNKNQKHKKPQ